MKWLRDYFKFTKAEERGINVWLILSLLLIILPYLSNYYFPYHFEPAPEVIEAIAEYDASMPSSPQPVESDSTTAIRNSPKFTSKSKDNYSLNSHKKESHKSTVKSEHRKSNYEKPAVDISTADTTKLKTIYGIGPVLSKRIVKYRELLGGFNSINQINEVYGIDSAKFDQIKNHLVLNEIKLKPININLAEYKTLIRHPYLDKNQVKVLLNYRKQHGEFGNIEEILETGVFTPLEFEKLKPYITTSNANKPN